jgi:putative transposase
MIDRCRDAFPIQSMCRLLKVSTSGYYDWRDRPLSLTAAANERLFEQIDELHQASDGVWGAPTITEELQWSGVQCSKNRVARLMRLNRLQGIPQKKRWRKKASAARPAGINNQLKRDFKATAANQKWVTDITYVATQEGFLYLCTVKDLYCGSIIGWSMSAQQTRDIVIQAVLMALWQRNGRVPVVLHSDRGTQFTSHEYQRFLKGHNVTCSMSAVGSCADNASAESFFGQLKRERVNRRKYQTRAEARTDIFDYIEMFYNPRKQRQLAARPDQQLHLTKPSVKSG